MSTINSKEINDKISALPSREQLSKEQQRQEDISAINDYALRNPTKVFDKDFTRQRQHLTEETWKAVIQANPDMQDSASPKWRHIPNADIVNKYQGQAFSGEVRKAINEDGVKLAGLTAAVPGAIIGGGALAKPVLSQMFYHPGTFFAETIGGTIGGYAGGAATDAITRGVSDYDSFANMIASNSTIPEQYAEMLNPGMLLGGIAGGVGGNVLYNNTVKPAVQKAALPYLMARQLNQNIDNAVLPTTLTPEDKIISAGTTPHTNSKTSLKFYERPSTLTEAERLGIPKGERNNNKRYGNIKFIRNIGLHNQPNYMPYMIDDKIKLSSDENLLVNLTTDLPFRTHQKYAHRPGGEIMIIDPKAFRGQTFLSLDPSDSMILNKDLVVDPKHVQIITGNKDIAKTLSQSGITTYTSPKLQIEYKKAMQEKPQIQIGKIRLDKKNFGDTPNKYTKAVDDFITKYIGRPDLGDYQKLQQTTNINPHVTEFNDQINQLQQLLKLNTTKLKGSSDLEDINLFTFPDKTSFTYYDVAVPSTIKKTIDTPYKNVFYNPFSSIENDLMHSLGISQHPKYSDEFQNILKQYILKNNIKPLKKQGGTINYLNLFKNNFQK